MKTYRSGETVAPGLYLSVRQLAFKAVDEEGPLPGAAGETYRRVPALMMLVVGPLLGLVYVMFLPFLGVAMVTWLLGVKGVHAAEATARQAARVLRPGWEPAMAFFSRSRTRAGGEAPHRDAWAEEVRKQVEPEEHEEA